MREDLKELLEVAEEDLKVAKDNYSLGNFRICAFLCQQAVEKFLKAYLLEKKGEFPFIHSIKMLTNLCIQLDEDFEYLFEISADKLDKYYTGTRYLPLIKISEEEAREALEITEKVRGFVLKKLKAGGGEQYYGKRT